jgi:hypothetical protein
VPLLDVLKKINGFLNKKCLTVYFSQFFVIKTHGLDPDPDSAQEPRSGFREILLQNHRRINELMNAAPRGVT